MKVSKLVKGYLRAFYKFGNHLEIKPMMRLKSFILAGVVAVSGTFAATNADALFLSGTFNIDIYNYDAGGVRANAAATQTNINTFGGAATFTSITYTGALDFRITNTAGSATTTIADFLSSGSAGAGGFDADQLGATGGLMLSSGQGTGDAGATAAFRTTTLFKITFESFSDVNIDNLSQIISITHDDGFTMTDGTGTVGNTTDGIFGGPTGIITTTINPLLSGSVPANAFSLIYAAANGDPSVLEVNVVPLPAALWLLLGVSGALVAAKRRSVAKAA
ncbi:MAG: hypothetical protein ACXIUW_04510 [Roseinatronobacter sp.]